MEEAAIQLGLFVIREAIQHAPELKQAFVELITKEDATIEDWQNLRDQIRAKGYLKFVPKSRLPQARD